MEDTRITACIKALGEEIKSIQDLERRYRTTKPHSRAERMEHASRELRLVEIQAQLEKLKKQKQA